MKHRGRMMAVGVAVIATLALGATAAFAARSASTSTDSQVVESGFAAASTSTSPTAPPPGGPGRGGGRGGHGGMGAGLVEVVSKLTGESTSTIMAARQSGTSFAHIAEDNGVAVAEIIELASHAPEAALASQVSDGLITQAQASETLSDLESHWTAELDSTTTGPGPGGHGRGGHPDGPPSQDGSTSDGTSGSDGTSSSTSSMSGSTSALQ